MTTMLDLEAPANEITKLLDDITDDQLSASTPCENTTVGDLLDHFMGIDVGIHLRRQEVVAGW